MNMRIFDDQKSKEKNTRPLRGINHVEWVKSLVRVQGAEKAIRMLRALAPDFHIGHKKQSEPNKQAGFYKSALAYALKVYGKSTGKSSEPATRSAEPQP